MKGGKENMIIENKPEYFIKNPSETYERYRRARDRICYGEHYFRNITGYFTSAESSGTEYEIMFLED
jgi:hypothetical protein